MRELAKRRGLVFFWAGLAVLVLMVFLAVSLLLSEKKELKQLKDQRKEMMTLRDDFIALRQNINLVEGKKRLSNVQGVVQAVDEVFSSIGLRGKVKDIKSTGKRETKDGFEEQADISVEKVSMNEMLNILYRIDRAPMILTVKKASIKKSFESPELLNLTLELSFLKAK